MDDEQKHDYPSRPVVERADELAEGQVVLNVLDGRVGLVWRRAVVEHHCPACDEQNHQAQEQQGTENMSPTDGGRQRLRPESVPSTDQPCFSFKPIQKATQHSATPFITPSRLFQVSVRSAHDRCPTQTLQICNLTKISPPSILCGNSSRGRGGGPDLTEPSMAK